VTQTPQRSFIQPLVDAIHGIPNMSRLCMKECSFVCKGEIAPYHCAFACILCIDGKPLMSRHASSWFHNVLTYGGEIAKYSKNKSLKILLNNFFLKSCKKILVLSWCC